MTSVLVDMGDWRLQLDSALRLRNRLQRDNPAALIETYNKLFDKYSAAKSKLRQFESDAHHASFAHAQSFSHPPTNSSTAGAANSGEVEALKNRLLALQDQLNQSYRLQAETSATSLRLKEAAERDERELLAKEEECGKLRRETEVAKAELKEEKETRARKEKLLESSLEVVRREWETMKKSYTSITAEREKLLMENETLLRRIMQVKEEHVKYVNDMNELIASKKSSSSAAQSSNTAALEAAAIAAQRELESKRRAEVLAVTEVDMTSSSAIIDQLSWQQNFRVQPPTEKKRSVRAHRGQCLTATISPSGLMIASGGTDGFVKLIDARTGILKAALKGSKDSITSASLSVDDSLMLAAGNDQSARLWAIKPQALSHLQQAVKSSVSSVSSSLSSTLTSLSDAFGKDKHPPAVNNSGQFSPKILHTLLGHTSKINSACFDADSSRQGGRAYTGSHDRTIRVWDLTNGSNTRKIMCGSACNHLSLSSGRGIELIASAHLDSHVRFWDVSGGVIVKDLDGVHHQQVTSVEFSRDGQLCVTNSRDNTVAIIDTRTWQPLHSLEGPVKEPYRNLVNFNRACFSPDGQFVAAGGVQGSLYVWAVDSGKCVTTINPHANYDSSNTEWHDSHAGATAPDSAVTSVDWNRNGRQVIVSDMQGNVHFFAAE